MGKNTYCTYCLEFHRRTKSSNWGSNSNIQEGCKECHRLHDEQVKSLQLVIVQNEKNYETDLLKQKTEFEQLLSESSLEVSELKDDVVRLQKKVQFLQVPRDSFGGDIVIAVPGHQVTAHRAVLASKSPVFQKMIQSTPVAKSKEVIRLLGASPSVLEAIVKFCYTGNLAFSELVPADEVLKFAHTFELGLLREYCDTELCRGLTVDNVPQMLKLSRKFEVPRLFKKNFKNFDLLEGNIYKILEGSDSNISESCSGASPDLDEQWNKV